MRENIGITPSHKQNNFTLCTLGLQAFKKKQPPSKDNTKIQNNKNPKADIKV